MWVKYSFVVVLLCLIQVGRAQDSTSTKTKVFHFVIDDNIDARTNRKSELALAQAKEMNADLVILELDTYGGALNDADEIRTRILNFEKPVYAFINKDAASAGALISIACDSIYMAKGASIGAATVVTEDGAAAPDKYQSYMRSIMRSTAEATGRNPRIAEAMVDQDIDLDSIATEGKVVTFSVSEAIKFGFCEAEVATIDQIIDRAGIESYEITHFEISLTEKIIAFFINPAISGILILIIIGGIYFELQSPGIGFPIAASIIAAILYFIPYYLNGLAANWEIILFGVGVLLIALEVFVIPGFGVAGISGIIVTILALVLVMVGNDDFDFTFVNLNDISLAVISTLAGIFGAFIVMIVGGAKLPDTKFFKRVALQGIQETSEGYTSSYYKASSLVGKTGNSFTILRPSGKVEIEGKVYDAYTRGEYIETNTPIVVISDEGTSLKVKAQEA